MSIDPFFTMLAGLAIAVVGLLPLIIAFFRKDDGGQVAKPPKEPLKKVCGCRVILHPQKMRCTRPPTLEEKDHL